MLLPWSRKKYSFHNQVVLITGGSRGLGLVLARRLAREGAKLALCARDAEELQNASDDLRSRCANVATFVCDLRQKSEVEQMVAQVKAHYGRIDVVINNAGVIQVGPLEETTLEDYEQAMLTHFWGPLYLTFAVLPDFRKAKSGRIVNISSVGGKFAAPHLLPYCASKFALAGFSQGLRFELAQHGIVVTSVFPGLMRTGSPRNAFFKGQHRKEYAWFKVSDSLPLVSMKAERAAHQILEAVRRGDAEVVLSLPAILATKASALFPNSTSLVMGWVNRLLPGPGGVGKRNVLGSESESAVTQSPLTALTRRAATQNNEI